MRLGASRCCDAECDSESLARGASDVVDGVVALPLAASFCQSDIGTFVAPPFLFLAIPS
jgi:hypothetical protein